MGVEQEGRGELWVRSWMKTRWRLVMGREEAVCVHPPGFNSARWN